MGYRAYLEKLQEFPNRGNGHENEWKAAKLIKSEYQKLGYEAHLQYFTMLVHSWLAYFLDFFWYGLAAVFIIIDIVPLAIISTFLGMCSFLGWPFDLDKIYRFLFPSRSQNVYAELPAKEREKRTLVIVGHYDTGKVVIGARVFAKLYEFFVGNEIRDKHKAITIELPQFFRTPAFLANLILLNLILGITFRIFEVNSLYLALTTGFALFWSVAHLAFIFDVLISPYVPGALDNGSGAAMVLDLAKHFKKQPLTNTRIIFLNSGSEENRPISNGAAYFYKHHTLDRENTYFLNFECLGSKHLVCTTGESDNRGHSHPGDRQAVYFLSKFIEKNYKDKVRMMYLPIACDARSLHRVGAKVITTLVGVSDHGMSDVYHTMQDTLDRINWETMEKARTFLVDFIEHFDSEFNT